LRPDIGRTFQVVQWTFTTFPDWHRCRDYGWFPFAFLPSGRVSGHQMSVFFCHVLRTFYAQDGFNFAVGASYCFNGEEYNIRAPFCGNIIDEKAHKEIMCCKGASGLKCCVSCRNVWNMKDASGLAAGEVHYRDSDMTNIVPHTKTSFLAGARAVADGAKTLNKDSFEELQKLVGLTFVPKGLPWDSYAFSLCPFPSMVIWDWMHNAIASGGVCQYQINFVICHMVSSKRFTLADFDQFHSILKLPKKNGKLRSSFFQDRVVLPTPKKPDPHLRAFASETLIAVEVLYMFAIHVLKPSGLFAEHVRCLELIMRAIDIFTAGDAAVQYAAELLTILLEHKKLYLQLYPYGCKPKCHYILHAPEGMTQHNVNLSCLPGERLLRIPKQAASHCFREFTKTMTRRVLAKFLENISQPDTFQSLRLCRCKSLPTMHGQVHAGHVVTHARNGLEAMTSHGTLKRHDIVYWSDGHGVVYLGETGNFLELSFSTQKPRFFAEVTVYTKRASDVWMIPSIAQNKLLDLQDLRAVTCLCEGSLRYPRFPLHPFA
jgi:hypothetical protein